MKSFLSITGYCRPSNPQFARKPKQPYQFPLKDGTPINKIIDGLKDCAAFFKNMILNKFYDFLSSDCVQTCPNPRPHENCKSMQSESAPTTVHDVKTWK